MALRSAARCILWQHWHGVDEWLVALLERCATRRAAAVCSASTALGVKLAAVVLPRCAAGRRGISLAAPRSVPCSMPLLLHSPTKYEGIRDGPLRNEPAMQIRLSQSTTSHWPTLPPLLTHRGLPMAKTAAQPHCEHTVGHWWFPALLPIISVFLSGSLRGALYTQHIVAHCGLSAAYTTDL